MRINNFILRSKGMDRYHNGKLMGKWSPREYTCVKGIETLTEKCIWYWVSLVNFIGKVGFEMSWQWQRLLYGDGNG